MATSVEIEPLIVVRETAAGSVYAYPLADPSLVCRATSVPAALAQQEAFLPKYLEKVAAWKLPEFVFPAESELFDLAVVLPRSDLSRRTQITSPITVPCIATPHGDARWVHVLPLGATVYVRPTDALEDRVKAEVEKAAGARELNPDEYRRLFPALRHSVERIRVCVTRQDLGDLSERATKQRKEAKAKARERSQKLLAQVGTDLREMFKAQPPPPVVGRDREIRSLAAILGGPDRLSVTLVGDEMAGKSAIVHGLVAQSLTSPLLGDRKIYATSGAQLVAGQSGFGQLQERIDQVMRAAEDLDAILYFDNLGDLLSGRAGSIEDMVSMIRPFLADDRVRVVGELSAQQLEHYEKQHVGFFTSLSRITVEPLSRETTAALLQKRIAHVARAEPHRPNLIAEGVAPLVQLCERYLAYQAFPGKAVRLYEELRAVHEAEATDAGEPKPIGPPEVYRAFSTRSGIPLFLLRDDQAVKFAEVEAYFAQRVIGQTEAIRRVAQTLCVVKAGLQPPAKPLANFLFIGPTGVGKTEVAKTLARFLFGGTDRMVRFDMSEYMDPLASERLIRGSERDEGELTRKVRQQPFCVVLLDEIEKAHPAVFDLLLQVCGEGRLTDARGRTTWFHNAIIIMTSNLGAAHRRPDTGFAERGDGVQLAEDRYYVEQVDKHFRPEFVNRIDRVIPFRSLGRGEIGAVAEVSLARVRERDGLLGRRVDLQLSATAVATLADGGYNDRYGARALRRHLEDALVAPLSALSSSLAADFTAASVQVSTPDEEAAPAPDGALLQDAIQGQLRFRAFRPAAQRSRKTLNALQFVASLRRDADRCMASDAIEELREKIDYMVADLASDPGSRSDVAAALAGVVAEHAHLSGLLAAVREAQQALRAAEDLTMAAQEEGEEAEMFVDEANSAFARFEVAFTRAVLGNVAGKAISFVARAVEHPRVLKRWLVPFLQAADERGWQVVLHRHEDRQRGDTAWPAELRWGPPRTLEWALERLREDKPTDIAKHWRGVLLRVKGPFAEGLLRLELGLVRYAADADADATTHVELIRMADQFELTTNLLGSKAMVMPKKSKAGEVSKAGEDRLWSADSVLVPGGALAFAVKHAVDYWRNLERVQFGLLTPGVLAGRELLGDDG